jgi:AraC family transcriptional regulator
MRGGLSHRMANLEDTRMTTESHPRAAYGEQMAKYFRPAKGTSLLISAVSKQPAAITRLTSDIGLPDRTASIPSEKAFVVDIHLTPASDQGCEIWVDDKHSRIMEWPVSGTGIYDLESDPRTRNPGPVDWVHYYVPRSTLDGFADDVGRPRIESLRCLYGTVDPVLLRMTQLVLPSLHNPHAFCELFLDYFRLLFCAHIARTYAPSFEVVQRFSGGLAPWQRRRVTELFREHLDGTLRLTTLADECGLSVSHFARSFRRSFGTSAHRYLIFQRVEMAKTLLSSSDRSLSEVALEAGFSDQAAFSRTFKALVGTSPGQWKREAVHRSGVLQNTVFAA